MGGNRVVWRSVTFGKVFEIQLGKMLDKRKNRGELHPYLANRNVRWGTCEVSELARMRFTEADRQKYGLRPGDLLVCEGGEVGRTAIWEGEATGVYFQKAIHRLRAREELHPRFVLHYMKWAAQRNLFARVTSATSIAHLTKAKLEKVPLPLPPLPEQKRIAAILDAADALRAKRRESIEQLDALSHSVFLDMFGDPVTNPKGWETAALREVIQVASGNGLTKAEMAPDGTFPVYGGNGISGYHDSYMFDEPRIILGRVGVYCGVVHLTRPRAWVTDNALYVKEFRRPIDQVYLVQSLRVANLNQYADQAAQPLISGGRIYPVRILLPPLDLQRRFTAIAQRTEQHTARLRAHLTELDNLFASLQSRAFRGEL